MTESGREFIATNLSKESAYLSLQPGDPWSFIVGNEQLVGSRVGDRFTRWFDTSENGREFEITAIHSDSVETRYIGFEKGEAD